MMTLKTNYGSVTGASIKVMLMHHAGDTLDYENDEDDHIVMKMMIRSVLINKKRAL